MYYMDSKLVFKFKPDTDMDTKLKIHIDITVATPCSSEYHDFQKNFYYFVRVQYEYLSNFNILL